MTDDAKAALNAEPMSEAREKEIRDFHQNNQFNLWSACGAVTDLLAELDRLRASTAALQELIYMNLKRAEEAEREVARLKEDSALLDWADEGGHYDNLYDSLREELRDKGARMPYAPQPQAEVDALIAEQKLTPEDYAFIKEHGLEEKARKWHEERKPWRDAALKAYYDFTGEPYDDSLNDMVKVRRRQPFMRGHQSAWSSLMPQIGELRAHIAQLAAERDDAQDALSEVNDAGCLRIRELERVLHNQERTMAEVHEAIEGALLLLNTFFPAAGGPPSGLVPGGSNPLAADPSSRPVAGG